MCVCRVALCAFLIMHRCSGHSVEKGEGSQTAASCSWPGRARRKNVIAERSSPPAPATKDVDGGGGVVLTQGSCELVVKGVVMV